MSRMKVPRVYGDNSRRVDTFLHLFPRMLPEMRNFLSSRVARATLLSLGFFERRCAVFSHCHGNVTCIELEVAVALQEGSDIEGGRPDNPHVARKTAGRMSIK